GQVYAEDAESTIEITDVEDLKDMRNHMDGSYKLAADIDLSSDVEWEPIGTEDEPFNGKFDGNDFTITGMNELFSEDEYKGLFASVTDEVELQAILVEFSVDEVEDEAEGETEENDEGISDSEEGNEEASESGIDSEAEEESDPKEDNEVEEPESEENKEEETSESEAENDVKTQSSMQLM